MSQREYLPQAKLLCKDFDLVHIAVGDMFRWHAQNRTKLGARVHRIMASGQLVPDEVVQEVVQARLELHDWNYGFILDGFPRNAVQAQFFLETYDIDVVILIEVPDAVVTERILSRRLCSGCGRDYNLLFQPPAVADTCDTCGGKLVPRADDTPQAVQGRLADYHQQTKPILDLFRRKHAVVAVDGTRGPGAIQEEIRKRR